MKIITTNTMTTSEIDLKIFSKVKDLNATQKAIVLDYLDRIPKTKHSTRLYRRKGLKQIRRALSNQQF